ncbi:HAMP domain-containing protein [Modestobacter sp. URMC 112]
MDAACVGHCSSVTSQDDDLAAIDAARKAVTGDVHTAPTLTDDAPLQLRRTPSLDRPLRAEVRPLGVPRAGSATATRTMSSTLVLAGLIGLLGVCGAAASIVHTVTGPVRRAVRVLQAPEKGRPGRRFRPTTLRELQDMSRAVDTAGHDPFSAARAIGADARSLSPASEGPTATSGPPSSGAVELPTPAAGSVTTTRYAAARSRAFGPTTALWHAVELDRLAGASRGACETTVCGSLVRMSTEQSWPVPARDVCPACSTLAH